MRASISACIRSQMAYPYGRMTIVPRTGPFSASSAFARTSWYHCGKSSDCEASTRDLSMAPRLPRELARARWVDEDPLVYLLSRSDGILKVASKRGRAAHASVFRSRKRSDCAGQEDE